MSNRHTALSTNRLLIEPLTVNEDAFILELLKSEGWKKFIGNRNVNSISEATKYIQRINGNPDTVYWVVKLKDSRTPIGLVTFIKREYLEHPDLGFAFLPDYGGKGHAYEAAEKILQHIKSIFNLSHLLATTVPKNTSSIKLLGKLGFDFKEEIEVQQEVLHVYAANLDK